MKRHQMDKEDLGEEQEGRAFQAGGTAWAKAQSGGVKARACELGPESRKALLA